MDISKINDIYEYADALGVAFNDLSFEQLADWVRAGKAPSVSIAHVDQVLIYNAVLEEIPMKTAQSALLQAILTNKHFIFHMVSTEGSYKVVPEFDPNEIYRFFVE